MKKLMALTLVLCMVLSLASTAMAAETMTNAEAAVAALNAGSDFYYELVENYADSDIEHRTEVRWWMCEGGHTDETLLEELQAMYDAGFRGVELFSIYLIFAVSTAANSGVISASMGCDGELAGEIVLTTTLFSLPTMLAGLMLLEHFALI